MSDFYKYFKENMDGLGLPAPENLFGTLQAAVGSATVILSMVDKFGKRVTVGELIGAGTRLEGLAVISACAAAFYVGAVAVLAWTFWHFLGKDAFSTLPTVMLIVVMADNVRLRRQLRRNTANRGSDT